MAGSTSAPPVATCTSSIRPSPAWSRCLRVGSCRTTFHPKNCSEHFALDSSASGVKMSAVLYTVINEPADDGTFSVYVPDLPGCVSTGRTRAEAIDSIREAIAGHVQTLRDLG